MNASQFLKQSKKHRDRDREEGHLSRPEFRQGNSILFVCFANCKRTNDIQVSAMFFQLGQFDKKFLELFKKSCLALLLLKRDLRLNA